MIPIYFGESKQGLPIYGDKWAYCFIRQAQDELSPSLFWKLYSAAILSAICRSFTEQDFFKGRPVMTVDDVENAARLMGVIIGRVHPAVCRLAEGLWQSKKILSYIADAPYCEVTGEELRCAATLLGSLENEFRQSA